MKKLILILAIVHITIVSFLSGTAVYSDNDLLRPASGNTADSAYIARLEMQHLIRTTDQALSPNNDVFFNAASRRNGMQMFFDRR